MRTHREPGKKLCATSTHIVPIGNPSKVSIDHGAANPAGQRAARHDRPRSQQAAHRTMSHVAEDDSSNGSGRHHPRYRALRGTSRLDIARTTHPRTCGRPSVLPRRIPLLRCECFGLWVPFGLPIHPLGVLHALRVLHLPGWLPPGLCGFFPVPSHSSAFRISRSCTSLANVEDSSLPGLVP
jgi:hypothetical protein